MKIITGRKYTDTGQPQMFDVTNQTGDRLDYTDPQTGYQGHVIVENNIVYVPYLFAGHYYPTQYKIEG